MIYIGLAFCIFVIDGVIKYRVEKYGKAGEILPAFRGKIKIHKHHNTGAMLSIGAAKQSMIAMISLLFTVFMTGVFVATLGNRGAYTLKMGLALLLGGAYSNTYDRLKRKYVVDYFSFSVKNKRLRNVIFNVSDFAIMIGAVLYSIGNCSKYSKR